MVVTTDVLPALATWEKVTSIPLTEPVPPFKDTRTPLPAGVFGEQVEVSGRTIVSPRVRLTVIVYVPGAMHVCNGMPPSSWGVSGLSALMPRATDLTKEGPQDSQGSGGGDTVESAPATVYKTLPSGSTKYSSLYA